MRRRVLCVLIGCAFACESGGGDDDDSSGPDVSTDDAVGPGDDGAAEAEDGSAPDEPGDEPVGDAGDGDDAVEDAGGDDDATGEADDALPDGDDSDAWGYCDSDGDRHLSPLCGGDDCDDSRADVHPLAVENCADGVDNDCDDRTDMEDTFCDPSACVPPWPAVDVSAGGTFSAPWHETTDWDDTFHLWSCMIPAWIPAYQALFRLTLTEAHDVHAIVTPPSGRAALALVSGCDPTTASGGLCIDSGYSTGGTFRNVAAGTWLLVAQYDWAMPGEPPPAGDVQLELAFSDPTPPPPNDRCEAAVDVSAGGTFEGTLLGARVDYEAPMCSSRSFADVAYRFTLTAPSDVELSVDPVYTLIVASDCSALRVTHLACRPSWATMGELPAGTYYALVGIGSPTSDAAGPFTLSVRIRTPHVPIPGDDCTDPVDVSPGGSVAGDLFGGTNWLAGGPLPGTVCGSTIHDGDVDAFFRFTLPDPRHLDIRVTSDTIVHMAVFTSCGDVHGTGVACSSAPWRGPVSALAARNVPAGAYLLRIQAASGTPGPPGPFTLDLGGFVPDSTCAAPEGGLSGPGSTLLSGTTSGSFDDHRGSCGSTSTAGKDVVYTLDLSARSRVVLDTTGSSGTVAYLRSTCESEASQVICAAPTAATTLEPGRYWIVVDSRDGPYSVTVDRITL